MLVPPLGRRLVLLAACLTWTGESPAEDSASARLAPFFAPPPELREQFGSYRSPLRFRDGREVKTPADWEARRREILAEWQEILGPWPPLLASPRMEILATTRREELTQHRVRVDIAAEATVEGYLLLPPGKGPWPAVLVPYYEPETSVGLSEQKLRDFGLQLAKRGFVTLSIGSPGGDARKPAAGGAGCQPLSFLAYVAANCHTALARRPEVDPRRIGIAGHSYGGKWAMFAACLHEKFACGVWSDPGIVFDETRPNVNYWEPWYLGRDPDRTREPGVPGPTNPRTGAYARLMKEGRDLHELLALHAPRPFLVSGGSEDPPSRWQALNHVLAVNRVLGRADRVAMTNRPGHDPTSESNEQIYAFFARFLQTAD